MKKDKLILISLIVLLFYSCSFNNVYVNREQDNKEGQIFLNNFYSNVAQKNYSDIDLVVGDSLRQLAGPDGIDNLLKLINEKAGNYKSWVIEDYYIKAVTGDKAETSYNYKLKVLYSNGEVSEIIGLTKKNGAEIKINSYHAKVTGLKKVISTIHLVSKHQTHGHAITSQRTTS